jgi:hypothetical protein
MSKGKNRNLADQRADMRGSGFVGLPRVVYESAAYQSLPPPAKVILWELLARFNGYNNGDIHLDTRAGTRALFLKYQSATGHAFATLMQRGLLDLAHECVWQERHARRWRLTFISTGTPPNARAATNEYLRWTEADRGPILKTKREAPRKYCATRGVADEAQSATRGVADPSPACDAGCSSGNGNEPFFQAQSATRGVAVISMPYGGGSKEPLKAPETAGGVSGETVASHLLEDLRGDLNAYLGSAGVGAQSRLAESAGISGGTLSKFRNGKGSLSLDHYLNVQLALQKATLRRKAA